MLFKPEMIEQIILEKKTQTRRLVKDNELAEGFPITKLGGKSKGIRAVIKYTTGKKKETEDYSPSRLKWKVGNKYAVCPGRGKPQVWYCPKCKRMIRKLIYSFGDDYCCSCVNTYSRISKDFVLAIGSYKQAFDLEMKKNNWKALFIELVSIRKEKLLSITESDAKKEGFENKKEFIKTFYKINTLHHPSEVVFGIWNPEVWVLSFSKVVD